MECESLLQRSPHLSLVCGILWGKVFFLLTSMSLTVGKHGQTVYFQGHFYSFLYSLQAGALPLTSKIVWRQPEQNNKSHISPGKSK